MCWSAIIGLDYCLDTKKLQEREENENLFVYQENIRKEKKNRVDNIKKKFCLVKKIVRKVILKVDVAFSCHVSIDVSNDFDK